MSDVFRKPCFSKKMFTNELYMGLLFGAQVENTVHGVETH